MLNYLKTWPFISVPKGIFKSLTWNSDRYFNVLILNLYSRKFTHCARSKLGNKPKAF